jgi:hypothetical protein
VTLLICTGDFLCYHWTQTLMTFQKQSAFETSWVCSVIVEKSWYILVVLHVYLTLNLKCIYICVTNHKTIRNIHFKCNTLHWTLVVLNVAGPYRNCDDLSNAAGHHIVKIHSFIGQFTVNKANKNHFNTLTQSVNMDSINRWYASHQRFKKTLLYRHSV